MKKPLRTAVEVNPSLSNIDGLAGEIIAALDRVRGRPTATLRAMRKEFSKRISGVPPETVYKLAMKVFDQHDFLRRWLAYELIHYHKPALSSLGLKELLALGEGMDRWEATDTFAPLLSGPAWREGQIPTSSIHTWAKSQNRWWRRAALVSTVGLNNKARGGKGDVERTLAICELLLRDRDDMVVKAMSWALRELSKHTPDAVRDFIDVHADECAPRVLREVKHKLETGLKNPRKPAK